MNWDLKFGLPKDSLFALLSCRSNTIILILTIPADMDDDNEVVYVPFMVFDRLNLKQDLRVPTVGSSQDQDKSNGR